LCSSYIILEDGFLTAATVAGISGIRLFSLPWIRDSVAKPGQDKMIYQSIQEKVSLKLRAEPKKSTYAQITITTTKTKTQSNITCNCILGPP